MSLRRGHRPLERSRKWGRSRDLGLGVRFAFSGGREGWIRAVLTAVGVGLGVAVLLLTTAAPNALEVRHDREQSRLDWPFGEPPAKSDRTLLIAQSDTTFRDKDIRGRMVEPEGAGAPLPPGVSRFPAEGDMYVSPALKKLLAADGSAPLRERLPYHVVGTIGEGGLVGSQELAYYAGATGLQAHVNGSGPVTRLERFGNPDPSHEQTDPVLLLLILVVIVVLLMPVAVFIAAAVRFGGERRDRRLAALRLIGSDSRMTRRIAAGEAMAGSLLGLVLGTVFFLAGRQFAGTVEVVGVSVWPSYLDPSPRWPRWSSWRCRRRRCWSPCSRCAVW